MPERNWAELHPGHKSLKHVARILEQRPKKDDHELSHLTRCLAAFREELIGVQSCERANPRDRLRLMHLNAVISIVMGMHFPVGDPPWGEFEKTRGWLEELVRDIEPERQAAPVSNRPPPT